MKAGTEPAPASGVSLSRSDIDAAWARISPYVRVTPVMEVDAAPFGIATDQPLTLKLELLQHTGSFKPRGAFNRILANEVPAAGVIAASGGNHGVAVAYAASRLGLPAEVFVPESAPAAKRDRIRGFGARVTIGGAYYDDAQRASTERAAATGALVVHPFDHVQTVAGQATIGRELAAQAPDVDTVLVAVGGGGLVAGVASWYAGSPTRIVSVEPELIPGMARALEAGEPVDVGVSGIAADSLGTRRIGAVPFALAHGKVAAAVLVPDDAIRAAQRALWDHVRLIAEPGGAAAFAALLCGAYRPAPGERVAVIVCGANTDPAEAIRAES